MILVSTVGPASCGDPQTGSTRVFIGNNLGVCRGGLDFAGAGKIVPTPSRVTIENVPIVLIGNTISPHGDNPHAAATTLTAQSRVYSSP